MNTINEDIPKKDRDWLRLLAGEDVPDADSDIRGCASALRQTVLDRQAEAEEQVSAGEIRRGKQRLMFRMKKEGLLDTPRGKSTKKNWSHYGLAIAASVVFMMIATPIFQNYWSSPGPGQIVSPPPVVKKFIMPQTIYVKNPRMEAGNLARDLSDIGLSVEKTEEAESVLLSAKITEKTGELETVLKKWHLTMDGSDTLLVEFLAKP